ncbi:hypothetical protein Ppro_0409 [Pelobacter propionicus DSM 2379]|uniref:Uncharacterized protein n=1 Tax=Pelobacter propionicus (strain DSM 2379 / NBRC 103807 / OttBd1) TaxID=338966 RepID=A1AL23_PELPD|nr:hypothetical protein Ppro_0409 [Pelobacter propionicus DSM 2379]
MPVVKTRENQFAGFRRAESIVRTGQKLLMNCCLPVPIGQLDSRNLPKTCQLRAQLQSGANRAYFNQP